MPASIDFLLDLFFPRQSLLGREGEWITREELLQMRAEPVLLDTRILRSVGVESLDRVVAAASYRQVPLLQKAIHTFKYRRIPALAGSLGNLLVIASYRIHDLQPPVVVPVPLHWTRKWWRGFNQAELLAQILSTERAWPLRFLLRRAKRTTAQVGLARRERLQNMQGAFGTQQSAVPPYVVLVDDVFTTGATLDACAAALKRAGVKRVDALVLARG